MNRIIATAAAAALTITALAGCTRTVVIHDSPTASPPPVVAPVDVVPSDTPSATFDYQDQNPTIALKVTSKQCFGDAGCNVTVKPVLSIDDPTAVPADATGSITYEIDGSSDGPDIETIDLTGSQYQANESALSTNSSGDKLTVKITDVTTDGQ